MYHGVRGPLNMKLNLSFSDNYRKGLHNFTHPRSDPVVIMIAVDETGDRILLGRNVGGIFSFVRTHLLSLVRKNFLESFILLWLVLLNPANLLKTPF